MRSRHRRAALRPLTGIALVCVLGVSLVAAPASVGAAAGTDWYTYGFDLHRTGENTAERVIGVANVGRLHLLWSTSLGGALTGQPMVAAGVVIGATAHNVIYLGDEQGHFAAVDEQTGAILWEHALRTVTIPGCFDAPNSVFGIGGAATVNRASNTVYIAAGDGAVHAYDLASGAERPGWPVQVFNPRHLHSYGGITADPSFANLYVQAASHCDFTPYHGSLTKIDVATHSIVKVFKPTGKVSGGGMWGAGGPSYDAATNRIYTATGNAITSPESYKYANHVVELDTNLAVVGSNYPGLTGGDVDFGATPILYQASGCPGQLAVKNKSGIVVVYTQDAVSAGPTQRIQVASVDDQNFNGIPAYSASRRMLYIGSSSDSRPYQHGMIAFTVGSDCRLTLAWNKVVGPNRTSVSPPTIANGVVYYGDGTGTTEYAFNAVTGKQLWSSGSQIAGDTYGAPTVVNGTLLVPAWDGRLYAFGP
jgi:outer membrane protein assembly factor BamB